MAKTVSRCWNLLILVVSGAALIAQFHLSLTSTLFTTPMRVVNYFSYFTIESNILVCVLAASLVLHPDRDGRRWRVARLDSVLAIAVTGLVYVTVLRPSVPLIGLENTANNGLHYATPILAVLGWAAFGPRPRFTWNKLLSAMVFPIVWLAYTLIRGAIVHWYPYPFLNVTSLGYAHMTLNVLVVTCLIIGVGALFVALDRKLPAAFGPVEAAPASVTPAPSAAPSAED